MIVSQRVRGLLNRLLARRRAGVGSGVDDAELLHRYARDRDEAAFELLVWRHGAMVLGLCRRRLRDEQLAEDAFQAVFLVLARKASGVRGNLGGWLFKVARRVSSRAAARRTVTAPVVDIASAPGPDTVEQRELSELLDAEVALLPVRLRLPVVLCYLGGISTEDAARELGCPRGTVLSRLAAARTRLAERLTRRGVTLPAVLVLGAGMTSQTVSATLATARHFALGTDPLTPPISLAQGVLHAMNRTALLTTLGGTAFALVLASGIGLVVAQNGPPVADASGAASVPAAPAAPNDQQRPKPTPDTTRRNANEQLEKLERFARSLKHEMEVSEKTIELVEREHAAREFELAFLQKRLAELEQELARIQREIIKLEAEIQFLKARDKTKPGNTSLDPNLVAEAIAADPRVQEAKLRLTRSQARLKDVQSITAAPDSPQLKALADEIAAHQQAVTTAETAAREKATELVRDRMQRDLKVKLDELAAQVALKQNEREKLLAERDELRKLITTKGGSRVQVEALRKALEPQREMLAKIERQMLHLRAQNAGIMLPEETGADAKLDAILKELAALRKEVQELKQHRK